MRVIIEHTHLLRICVKLGYDYHVELSSQNSVRDRRTDGQSYRRRIKAFRFADSIQPLPMRLNKDCVQRPLQRSFESLRSTSRRGRLRDELASVVHRVLTGTRCCTARRRKTTGNRSCSSSSGPVIWADVQRLVTSQTARNGHAGSTR